MGGNSNVGCGLFCPYIPFSSSTFRFQTIRLPTIKANPGFDKADRTNPEPIALGKDAVALPALAAPAAIPLKVIALLPLTPPPNLEIF